MRRSWSGSIASSHWARSASIFGLSGQPSQAALPSVRSAWLPNGLVFGIERSISVKKMFQPPLSGGAWLVRRRIGDVPSPVEIRSAGVAG